MRLKNKYDFSSRIFYLSLAAAIPSYLCALIFLWYIPYSGYARVLLASLLSLTVFGFAWAIKQRLNIQFQTLSSLVEAIRGGDFTLRGKKLDGHDPLTELLTQINLLAQNLSEQRLASEEAYRLLDKTIAHINVAIFVFDAHDQVKLANPAAGRLLATNYQQLPGRTVQSLGMIDFFSFKQPRLIEYAFPGGAGRWQVRLDSYRDAGMQRKLLFITDLKTVLREEELKAWKNLIKVISHEVNNSLYPISSISQTLSKVINCEPLADDWRTDMTEGLAMIGERVGNLTDFIKRYAKVARLPDPDKQLFTIGHLITHSSILQNSADDIVIAKNSKQNMQIFADQAMIEQLLINLLKNAVEAGPPVVLSWGETEATQWLKIIDHGPGISNPANLFVPFYSTKPKGSGIGLVLCQQILDKHNGSLAIDNLPEGGCQVVITLPRHRSVRH